MRKPEDLKNILLAGILTALTGEIYIYPFGTGFRFTMGVITLSFLVLNMDFVSEFVLIPFCGLNMVLLRIFLSIVFNNMIWEEALRLHFPSLFFYLSYAVLLGLGRIRRRIGEPLNFITIMALSDLLSNFVELSVRGELNIVSFQERYPLTLTVGFIRSVLTYFTFLLFEHSKIIIVQEEHQKRYGELLALLAELKAELFYIKKSTGNLEGVMKESYEIYQILDRVPQEGDMEGLKHKALNLARDIHEIKKDYMRIAAGVAELLPEESHDGMRLTEMLNIIKANTDRWIKARGIEIDFRTDVDVDLLVRNYFSVASVINNLISNALDAFEGPGKIHLDISLDDGTVNLTLSDDGKGISPKDLPFIFEPGFSTKFAHDGTIFTGLGLTHAKILVEDMGGEIRVESPGRGTTFRISLPARDGFMEILS